MSFLLTIHWPEKVIWPSLNTRRVGKYNLPCVVPKKKKKEPNEAEH